MLDNIRLGLVIPSCKIEKESLLYFNDKKYIEGLHNYNKKKCSIIWRYYISKKNTIYNDKFYPRINEDWIPIYNNNIYWSLSHKEHMIFFSVWDIKHWVDIEYIKRRSKSLLNIFWKKEYNILWRKDWLSFYRIWTAKESIIKLNLGWLDDMKEIQLEYKYDTHKIIDNIKFDIEMVFIYNSNRYKVLSWIFEWYTYSVAITD